MANFLTKSYPGNVEFSVFVEQIRNPGVIGKIGILRRPKHFFSNQRLPGPIAKPRSQSVPGNLSFQNHAKWRRTIGRHNYNYVPASNPDSKHLYF